MFSRPIEVSLLFDFVATSITYICGWRVSLETYAIFLPSGLHVGWPSLAFGVFVRRVNLSPCIT